MNFVAGDAVKDIIELLRYARTNDAMTRGGLVRNGLKVPQSSRDLASSIATLKFDSDLVRGLENHTVKRFVANLSRWSSEGLLGYPAVSHTVWFVIRE